MKKTIALGIVFLLVMLSFTSISGNQINENIFIQSNKGNTLYVGGSGPANYSRIQDAIDNTSNGDTVFVFDDSSPYYENIIINKSISLVGEDKNNTKIEGYSSDDVVIITSDWVNVSGFTIQHSGDNSKAGFEIHSNYTTIIGNNILNNKYGISFWSTSIGNIIMGNTIWNNYNFGIISWHSNNNSIINNTIINNMFGLHLQDADNNKVIDNNISSNEEGITLSWAHNNLIIRNIVNSNSWGGLALTYSSSNNSISNNTVISNNKWGIVTADSSNNNTISYNSVISNNQTGIYLYYYTNNNNILDNIIISNGGAGIFIQGSSYNNITCNTISNNKIGIRLWNYDFDNFKCYDNIIYHNNLINNVGNAYDEGENIWNDSYPSGGNYFDDYTGVDNDGDGIGDIPYPISWGNVDYYPLMEPWGGNNPPEAPTINGPTNGKPGVDYDYSFATTDSDGDYVWYHIGWGDKEIIYIYGPYPSDEEITLSYNWTNKGTYLITCWARDSYDAESNTTTFEVIIPRVKAVTSSMLLLRILERFPLLQKLIQQLGL
jgi:parallel beta-helix repeat protein